MAVVRLRRRLTEEAPPAPPPVATAPAAPPGPPGAPPPPAPPAPAAPAATEQKTKAPHPVMVIGAMLAVFVATYIANSVRLGPGEGGGFTPVEGLSVFALFYVFAQALERFLEPIVSLEPLTPAVKEAKRDRLIVAGNQTDDAATKAAREAEAALVQAEIDRFRANRTVAIWAFATIISLFVSAKLRLFFLVPVGVVETAAPDWLHILVTALVIGGGTKPLHDLITRIQAAKETAQDPEEASS